MAKTRNTGPDEFSRPLRRLLVGLLVLVLFGLVGLALAWSWSPMRDWLDVDGVVAAIRHAGESLGPAAAVAAGCSFFDIGSDTGDSIRQPAHVCGIAGIMTMRVVDLLEAVEINEHHGDAPRVSPRLRER